MQLLVERGETHHARSRSRAGTTAARPRRCSRPTACCSTSGRARRRSPGSVVLPAGVGRRRTPWSRTASSARTCRSPPGAQVKNAMVRDSIVNENAVVEDILLEGSVVGENAVVRGGFQRLNVGDSSEIACLESRDPDGRAAAAPRCRSRHPRGACMGAASSVHVRVRHRRTSRQDRRPDLRRRARCADRAGPEEPRGLRGARHHRAGGRGGRDHEPRLRRDPEPGAPA